MKLLKSFSARKDWSSDNGRELLPLKADSRGFRGSTCSVSLMLFQCSPSQTLVFTCSKFRKPCLKLPQKLPWYSLPCFSVRVQALSLLFSLYKLYNVEILNPSHTFFIITVAIVIKSHSHVWSNALPQLTLQPISIPVIIWVLVLCYMPWITIYYSLSSLNYLLSNLVQIKSPYFCKPIWPLPQLLPQLLYLVFTGVQMWSRGV